MQHWPVLLYVYFSWMCFFPELAFLSVSPELHLAKGGFKKLFPAKADQNEPFLPAGTTNASMWCGVAVRLDQP